MGERGAELNKIIVSDNGKMFSVVKGKHAFVAGVEWKTVPSSFEKNVRVFVKKNKDDMYVSCQYNASSHGGKYQIFVSSINKKKLKLPKNVSVYWSLALIITPLLEPGGYAIFPLTENIFGFVSCINGILINDLIGSREEITEALNTFLQFNTTPESGWCCYVPEGWGQAGKPLPVDTLLDAKRYPDTARFRNISHTAIIVRTGAILLLLIMAYYGFNLYRQYQEDIAAEAERQAMTAKKLAEQKAAQILPPWQSLPSVTEFIAVCSEHSASKPLSVVGWKFSVAECGTDGKNGSVRYSYSAMEGVTIADFTTRMKELFDGKFIPYFNLPEGNSGGFTEPVDFKVDDNTVSINELPSGSELQERLTTFSQKMRVKLIYQKKDNSILDEEGKPVSLPWEEYELSMQTSIPPDILFQAFNEPAVRLNLVSKQLNGGRIIYDIKGTFYVKSDK